MIKKSNIQKIMNKWSRACVMLEGEPERAYLIKHRKPKIKKTIKYK